jgi:multisubunit Na+/H+ antiporter MnhC subunit
MLDLIAWPWLIAIGLLVVLGLAVLLVRAFLAHVIGLGFTRRR